MFQLLILTSNSFILFQRFVTDKVSSKKMLCQFFLKSDNIMKCDVNNEKNGITINCTQFWHQSCLWYKNLKVYQSQYRLDRSCKRNSYFVLSDQEQIKNCYEVNNRSIIEEVSPPLRRRIIHVQLNKIYFEDDYIQNSFVFVVIGENFCW